MDHLNNNDRSIQKLIRMGKGALWCGIFRNGNIVIYDAKLQSPESEFVLLFMNSTMRYRVFEKNDVRHKLYSLKIPPVASSIVKIYLDWLVTDEGQSSVEEGLGKLAVSISNYENTVRKRHHDFLIKSGLEGKAEISELEATKQSKCSACGGRVSQRSQLACSECHFIICSCGACGCRQKNSKINREFNTYDYASDRHSISDEEYEIIKELEDDRWDYHRSESEGWFYPD